jgi:hypothetical protein
MKKTKFKGGSKKKASTLPRKTNKKAPRRDLFLESISRPRPTPEPSQGASMRKNHQTPEANNKPLWVMFVVLVIIGALMTLIEGW